MADVKIELENGVVEGECDERFQPVLDAFVANFRERDEVGAALCLYLGEDRLVDVWGGQSDAASGKTWNEDTLAMVFSSTKGATALATHLLLDSETMTLDQPVADLWPEFATAGKELATVRMMLDHSAGTPALRESLPTAGWADWDLMCRRLADEPAFWEPGTRHGYHGFTFGWTVGELVRRAGGKGLGAFLREAWCDPLDLDFWIGLPEDQDHRACTMQFYKPSPDDPDNAFRRALVGDPESIPARFWFNTGGFLPKRINTRQGRAAEIGAANGMTTARALAGLYAPLANNGRWKRRRLISTDAVARMAEVSSAGWDNTLLMPTRFTTGFMKAMDNRARGGDSVILGGTAFGHVGAGGSIGFADPAAKLSFGYVMNRMGGEILLNERGQSLVDAAYRCLGYRSDRAGVWAR
ncbi:MAG: serine hydrolase domain-containing protein [Alphaproteobacteria bacterium]